VRLYLRIVLATVLRLLSRMRDEVVRPLHAEP
jgi:hypothetical protein